MKWTSLTVVTPSLAADEALALTGHSLQGIAKAADAPTLRWIVVLANEPCPLEIPEFERSVQGLEITVIVQSPAGVYPAINTALDYCSESPLVILGAGDVLLPSALSALTEVGHSEVLSGLTSWHESAKSSSQPLLPSRSRSFPALALFRSHQGMVFGPGLRSLRYAEEFPVAADLDVKLRLWRQGSMREIDIPIASCLVGGVSDRRPHPRELRTRARELRSVFNRHFSRVHAEGISAIHAARLAQRSLGLRKRGSGIRVGGQGSQ